MAPNEDQRYNQGNYNPNAYNQGYNQNSYNQGTYNQNGEYPSNGYNNGYNPNGMPPKPSNYLVLAILCTICCCLPTGIAAIVYSAQVDSAYNTGNYYAALNSSNKAKTWCIVSVCVSLVANIVYMVFWGGAVYASLLDI